MSDRVTVRRFPNADQVAVANGTVLNQSRVTFSGQRGRVLVRWNVQLRNEAAAAILGAGVNIVGTAPFTFFGVGRSNLAAAIGSQGAGFQEAIVLDPPAGSFLEASASLTGGTVLLSQNEGAVSTESSPPSVEEGPIVTVAV